MCETALEVGIGVRVMGKHVVGVGATSGHGSVFERVLLWVACWLSDDGAPPSFVCAVMGWELGCGRSTSRDGGTRRVMTQT